MFEGIHWLDLTVVALLAAAALAGALRGFYRQFVHLLTYIASVYGTIYLHRPLTAFVEQRLLPAIPDSAPIVSSLLTYVLTFPTIFAGLALAAHASKRAYRTFGPKPTFGTKPGQDLQRLAKSLFPRFLDRILGAAVGTTLMGLVLGTMLTGLALFPLDAVETRLSGSQLRAPLLRTVQGVVAAIPPQDKQEILAAMTRLRKTGNAITGQAVGQGLHGVASEVNTLTSELQQVQRTAADLGIFPDAASGDSPSAKDEMNPIDQR